MHLVTFTVLLAHFVPSIESNNVSCQLQLECSNSGGEFNRSEHIREKLRIPVHQSRGPAGPRGSIGPRGPPGVSRFDLQVKRREKRETGHKFITVNFTVGELLLPLADQFGSCDLDLSSSSGCEREPGQLLPRSFYGGLLFDWDRLEGLSEQQFWRTVEQALNQRLAADYERSTSNYGATVVTQTVIIDYTPEASKPLYSWLFAPNASPTTSNFFHCLLVTIIAFLVLQMQIH
ncbi:hypothetical protein Ciccas_013687 [Cichlidogyrus casuarinus]|uniref:Uncharacterized protein n=1 Tax=Cichlidogyrus casuarinus TaxID=1844966 RepID=A0ABD2PJY7_9PLAT